MTDLALINQQLLVLQSCTLIAFCLSAIMWMLAAKQRDRARKERAAAIQEKDMTLKLLDVVRRRLSNADAEVAHQVVNPS